jgi:hypothetical protein
MNDGDWKSHIDVVMSTTTSNSQKIKVLTVGDGNLSLSLSLSRAYNEHIDLTASVLESDRRDFLSVFSEAEDTLEELKNRNAPVVWNVDATQLHVRFLSSSSKITWDLVSFHHPHIGLSNLLEEDNDDEAKRALIHHRLLCHYLYSASQVSKLVHICLTHTQPTTWKLFEAAERQNLTLVKTISDSKPFANVWSDNNEDAADCDNNNNNTTMTMGTMITGSGNISEAAKIEPHFAAPRRYRNGKLSNHFLGKYGYQHRRTEGDTFKGSSNTKDVSVSGSMHFVFASKNIKIEKEEEADSIDDTDTTKFSAACNDDKKMICSICNEIFDSELELKTHLASPVRTTWAQTSIVADDDNDDVGNAQHSIIRDISHQGITKKESDQNVKRILSTFECSSDDEVEQLQQHDHDDTPSGTVLVVPKDCHGKRLRWFLHHSKNKEYQFTKRLAESAIQAGLVVINGNIVLDSSRILNAKDRVCIVEGAKEEGKNDDCNDNKNITTTTTTTKVVTIQKLKYKNHTKIKIVQRSSSFLNWLVALKPSGMRTKGTNPGTLETNVSEQEGSRYVSLSSLETSCPGLCVLVKFNNTAKEEEINNENQISIRHFLTVLVHGELLPVDVWFPSRTGVQMVVEAKWKQKAKINKKRKQIISESESESSSLKIEEQQQPQTNVVYTSIDITPKESTTMAVQEYPDKQNKKTTTKTTTLSTVEVTTSEPSSGSICNFFRQVGFPVVGDKFCKQEYSNLKRSIRNRIKNKLCIGCFKIEITIIRCENKNENDDNDDDDDDDEKMITKHVIESPSLDKLSALFWGQFLQHSGGTSEG